MRHNPSYGNKNDLMDQQNSFLSHVDFLICRQCFWCASYIYDLHKMLDRCPLCDENNTIESIPISSQEAYRFNYDLSRGVTLEFFPKDKTSISHSLRI